MEVIFYIGIGLLVIGMFWLIGLKGKTNSWIIAPFFVGIVFSFIAGSAAIEEGGKNKGRLFLGTQGFSSMVSSGRFFVRGDFLPCLVIKEGVIGKDWWVILNPPEVLKKMLPGQKFVVREGNIYYEQK